MVDRGASTRYRALETIRQYGEEQLATAGELATVQAHHDRWCRLQLSELAAAEPDDAWCFRFDRVVDDVRAALLRCAADPDRCGPAAELATQLAGQLWLRGRLVEAQHRYEQAAELSPSPADRVEQLRMAAGAAGTGFLGKPTASPEAVPRNGLDAVRTGQSANQAAAVLSTPSTNADTIPEWGPST